MFPYRASILEGKHSDSVLFPKAVINHIPNNHSLFQIFWTSLWIFSVEKMCVLLQQCVDDSGSVYVCFFGGNRLCPASHLGKEIPGLVSWVSLSVVSQPFEQWCPSLSSSFQSEKRLALTLERWREREQQTSGLRKKKNKNKNKQLQQKQNMIT